MNIWRLAYILFYVFVLDLRHTNSIQNGTQFQRFHGNQSDTHHGIRNHPVPLRKKILSKHPNLKSGHVVNSSGNN